MADGKKANVYDYFLPVLRRYALDAGIFEKALLLTEHFQRRKDYPFNFELLNTATKAVLGMGVCDMAAGAARLVAGQLDLEAADVAAEKEKTQAEAVPELVRGKFVQELTAFCLALDDLMSAFYKGRLLAPPDSLQRIFVMGPSGKHDRQTIRFLRADGRYLDVSVHPKEAAFLSRAMELIAKGEE